ncbi:MAG: mechanosensitive ion channel family protein [Demequinaceae bacterium]|nr:mechanosensitive ion channel family protein [Demequinaceae bacterium]
MAELGITLVVAIGIWVLGRLFIRLAIRGLREGLPKGEGRLPRFLRRSHRTSAASVLEDRLEDERRQRRANTIGTALRSVLSAFVIITTGIVILTQREIDLGPILAGAGLIGVALGFGAQSLVKDLLGGMFILAEDQYGVGDWVNLGEAEGTVEEVGLRTTRLRGLDGTVWFVPNGEIRRVGNQSRLWSRAMVEIRVDPKVDVEVAKATLLSAAEAAITREDIAPVVLGTADVPGVESIARDAIVLRVFVQVRPGRQWDVQRAIRAEIHREFTKAKIRLAVSENRIYMPDGE